MRHCNDCPCHQIEDGSCGLGCEVESIWSTEGHVDVSDDCTLHAIQTTTCPIFPREFTGTRLYHIQGVPQDYELAWGSAMQRATTAPLVFWTKGMTVE